MSVNIATPALGRPGCAVLPMALNTGASAFSFGCRGNRTFTGLPEEEMYLAIPGTKWDAVVEALWTIAGANATMAAHYAANSTRRPCGVMNTPLPDGRGSVKISRRRNETLRDRQTMRDPSSEWKRLPAGRG